MGITHRFRVTPEQLPGAMRREASLVKRIMAVSAMDAAMVTQRVVMKDSPVDVGVYKNSWTVVQHVIDVRGLTFASPVKIATLGNDAPYAIFVELGTRPGHWVPIKVLINWAERKAGDLMLGGHIPKATSAFRKTPSGREIFKGRASLDDDSRKDVKRFAYAVRAKIHRDGLQPKYVLRNRQDFAERALRRALIRRMRARDDG